MNNLSTIKKVSLTLLLILVFRFIGQFPIYGINTDILNSIVDQSNGGLFELMNIFSGGVLNNYSILSLGIIPYITASIIVMMMTEFTPLLKEMNETPQGRFRITWGTRILSIVIKSKAVIEKSRRPASKYGHATQDNTEQERKDEQSALDIWKALCDAGIMP